VNSHALIATAKNAVGRISFELRIH